jgi:hypothetical protein
MLPKESNNYQKNRQDLRNSDLEVCCANIQPKLKNLRSSTKNQSFFMVSGGFLKFIQYWLNISALTQQIYLWNIFFFDVLTPLATKPWLKLLVCTVSTHCFIDSRWGHWNQACPYLFANASNERGWDFKTVIEGYPISWKYRFVAFSHTNRNSILEQNAIKLLKYNFFLSTARLD